MQTLGKGFNTSYPDRLSHISTFTSSQSLASSQPPHPQSFCSSVDKPYSPTLLVMLLFILAQSQNRGTTTEDKMVKCEEAKTQDLRIQWTDVDVEAAPRRPPLHRSNSSFSISSIHSRRGSIDPSSALPIEYRTVSYQIAESKEKGAAEIQKAKSSVARGMSLVPCCLFINLNSE